jgi:hypothetical protein
MLAMPVKPEKEPQYGPITINLSPKEWYAAMYVARTMRGVSVTQFCKDAVTAYVGHVIAETLRGEDKKGGFDPIGWFHKHTQVGLKRQQKL